MDIDVVFGSIEDDLQLHIDKFFDALKVQVTKESRYLKENLRSVCVDNPHVEFKTIHEIYNRLIDDNFEINALTPHVAEWVKTLKDIS